MEQEFEKWTCPKCGQTVRFMGPTTRRRFIEDHNYWQHEKPERERLAEATRQSWLASRTVTTALDDAFYDGARLSGTDVTFLKSVAACWKSSR
jgi:hypothetical protein